MPPQTIQPENSSPDNSSQVDPSVRPTAVASPPNGQTIVPSVLPAEGLVLPPSKGHQMTKKPIAIFLAVLLILAGGSAAAYFGYYVPNKPENILAKAFSNTLSEHQVTTKGTLDTTTGSLSTKIDYTSAFNEDDHTTDTKLNVTVSGINLPIEALTASGNAYFKVGDLAPLESLANPFIGTISPDLKALEDKLNKNLSNQWINVDSTLIKEVKLSCLTDFPKAFSQSDITALKTAYKTNSFASIGNHSTDTVGGTNAIKYDLKINDNALSKFDLSGSPYFKSLSDCVKSAGSGTGIDLGSLKDNDTTPITIWVDKITKRIIKYSTQTTAQDKSKGVSGSLTGTVSYDKVSINPPANSKPVVNLLNDIGLADLLNGFNSLADNTPSAKDTERKTDIAALQGHIEAYFADNGFYPTLADLNDSTWLSVNFKGLDPQALKDPDGSSAKLAATAGTHVYAYQAVPSGCDNKVAKCTNYTLTATLSDGSSYVKQSLN